MRTLRSATQGLFVMIGILAFIWPLLIPANAQLQGNAQWIFLLIFPLIFLVTYSNYSEDLTDSRTIATLGVLIAFSSVLRILGAGEAGIEPIWLGIILGGRVLRAQHAFLFGSLTLFVSALITGGVGPWLPYQMFLAAFIAMGAGALRNLRGRREIAWLSIFGVISSLFFGLFMDLQFWPWLGGASSIAYVPGDSFFENLTRFWVFHISTGFAWDIPRAIMTSTLLIFLGRPILSTLRRFTRDDYLT